MRRSGVHARAALAGAGPIRAGALSCGAGTAAWALTCLALQDWPVAGSDGPPTTDEVLGASLVWAAVALCGWLGITFAILALSAAPGALGRTFCRIAHSLTPHCARQALALALGASVGTVALPAPAAIAATTAGTTAAGPATSLSTSTSGSPSTGTSGSAADSSSGAASAVAPAAAGSGVPGPGFAPSHPAHGAVSRTTPAPAPGWVPDRPARVTSPEPGSLLGGTLRPAGSTIDTVTVRRGDTLWSIAARHLGSGASDSEVAAEWPLWFAANRGVIGDDPDVVLPGQLLRAPTAEVAR